MNPYQFAGRSVHRLMRPLIRLLVNKTVRTRIITRVNDEILVLEGWLSDGDPELPGGGLKRGEEPVEGAIRELREEVGIYINKDDLTLIIDEKIMYDYGFCYRTIIFELILKEKPILNLQKAEINSASWAKIGKLLQHSKTGLLLKKAGYPEKLE